MSSVSPVVAAIVPAFNEQETIGNVVKTLVASGRFRDVIVVSDGSSDKTAEVARQNGASYVHELPLNHGKGAAMLAGVARTNAEILFFCDADLIGLTKKHIDALLLPVLDGRLAMTVGLRERREIWQKIASFMPLISGQRAMERRVFEDIPDRYVQGYMVESSLNYYCACHKLDIDTVHLDELYIRRKIDKVGWVTGSFQYVRMCWQVIKAMTIVRIARLQGRF
jgi:glycosyltransferase involved in cell wall biosynthesis